MNTVNIISTDENNIRQFGICSYKNIKTEGYPEKLQWLKYRFPEGLKIKTLFSEKDGAQGMIEYIPGEYCWRPVDAKGYMFIHCVFTGYNSNYKGKGFGSRLIKECLNDAKKEGMYGVTVVTRAGSFMAGNNIFIKNGFEAVDSVQPDFELLVKKFKKNSPDPKFKSHLKQKLTKYKKGLTIIRSDQCPYTIKNVKEIIDTAKDKYGLIPKLVELKDYKEAQKSPSPFGTFCMIYNGAVITHHPISNTRFINIMGKLP